jgi:tetratricopeptide (TPR) repeat protein
LLAKQYPEDWGIHWYLGGFYLHELNQPAKAIPLLRKAVQWKPESEKSSLGLFHSLLNAGLQDEALDELKRFQVLTNFRSKDYREIIAELNDERPAPRKRSAR